MKISLLGKTSEEIVNYVYYVFTSHQSYYEEQVEPKSISYYLSQGFVSDIQKRSFTFLTKGVTSKFILDPKINKCFFLLKTKLWITSELNCLVTVLSSGKPPLILCLFFWPKFDNHVFKTCSGIKDLKKVFEKGAGVGFVQEENNEDRVRQ